MSYPSNLTFLSSKPNQLKQDSYFDSHDVGVEKKGGVQGYVFTFETLHYSWLLFSIKFCPPVLITKRLKKKKSSTGSHVISLGLFSALNLTSLEIHMLQY